MSIDSVMLSHAAFDLTTDVKQKEKKKKKYVQCPSLCNTVRWRKESNLSNYTGNIWRAFKRSLPNLFLLNWTLSTSGQTQIVLRITSKIEYRDEFKTRHHEANHASTEWINKSLTLKIDFQFTSSMSSSELKILLVVYFMFVHVSQLAGLQTQWQKKGELFKTRFSPSLLVDRMYTFHRWCNNVARPPIFNLH